MIVTFALQEDTGEPPASQRVQYTIESVRRFLPEAKIVQLTNKTFPPLTGVDEVLRYPNHGDFIVWAFGVLVKLCERDENILQIATDVLIQKDVSSVFDQTFDIAACRYPPRDRTVAFCNDVTFIKSGGGRLFIESLNIYLGLSNRDGWCDGQNAFYVATQRTSLIVKELDDNIFCRTPITADENMDDAAIVHFRGHRKRWMISYAKNIGL